MEKHKDYRIEEENIWIKCDIPFLSLLGMEICQEMNEHAKLNLQVLAEKEKERDILGRNWRASQISLWSRGETDELLFCGRAEKLICSKENQLLLLEIQGVGETIKLDRKKKRGLFKIFK